MLGRLELALGNLEAAGGYLRELPGRLLAGKMNDPTLTVWADAIETLAAWGSSSRHAPTWSSTKQMRGAWGARWPWKARSAAWACSTLPRATSRPRSRHSSAPCRAARPAVAVRARPHAALPRHGAQAGTAETAAREALEQALAIFEELPAPLWAEKARAELKRISGRAPASDELTETERRVAELAAQGRTNKEIAAELFMGVSTVEAHLSHAYRKLGIRSRAELGARLAKHRAEAAQA